MSMTALPTYDDTPPTPIAIGDIGNLHLQQLVRENPAINEVFSHVLKSGLDWGYISADGVRLIMGNFDTPSPVENEDVLSGIRDYTVQR